MDFLESFQSAFAKEYDPMIQKQIYIAKQEVRNDILRLIKNGVSLPDMFAKFGGILFKSQVL